MFLTTNRVQSIDVAFKSRIHLAVKYPDLSHSTRKNLWRAFIFRAAPKAHLEWVNSASLDQLANEELNGRQIKNVVRTAHALSVCQDIPLGLSHIKMALNAMKMFE